MPTYGSSDYGAYKRLMRSVSSSLVSNSSSLAIASNYDENNLNDTLNKSFNESTTPANCNNNVNNTPSLSLNTNNTIPFVGCKKCVSDFNDFVLSIKFIFKLNYICIDANKLS